MTQEVDPTDAQIEKALKRCESEDGPGNIDNLIRNIIDEVIVDQIIALAKIDAPKEIT